MTARELQKELRKLRKLKNQLHPGSKERLELGRKIKELKKQKEEVQAQNADKTDVIAQILGKDKIMAKLDIDLTKHTIQALQKYLDKLNKGGLDGKYRA